MNSDKEDPNNHAPAVTPDDDWDGLDVEQVFDAQLPPRRTDTGKMPKIDVNLTGFKSIEPARHAGAGGATSEDGSPKTSVSINMKVTAEREAAEKEDFQPALAMEDMMLDGTESQVIRKPVVPSRFKAGERDDWGTVHKKGSARWMLYVAGAVVILIVLTLAVSQMGKKKPIQDINAVREQAKAPVDESKVSAADLGLLGQLANSSRQAMEIYSTYAQAKQVDDFSDVVYLGERHSAQIAKAWQPSGAESGWKPTDSTVWKTLKIESIDCAELRGTNPDFSKFIAVFRFENDKLKMDWKATVGYGSADFEELKLGQGDGSEIRGWIEKSNFYTQTLPEDRYRSFIVRSPRKDLSVWVYTEIGTEVDEQVTGLFSVSPITGQYQSEAKVILNLNRGDQELLPSQWMVKGLIASNWLDQAAP